MPLEFPDPEGVWSKNFVRFEFLTPKLSYIDTHIVKITHINVLPLEFSYPEGAWSKNFVRFEFLTPKLLYIDTHIVKIIHINVLPLEFPDPEGGLVQNFFIGGTSTVHRIDCKKPEVSIFSQFWDLMHPASQPAGQPASQPNRTYKLTFFQKWAKKVWGKKAHAEDRTQILTKLTVISNFLDTHKNWCKTTTGAAW